MLKFNSSDIQQRYSNTAAQLNVFSDATLTVHDYGNEWKTISLGQLHSIIILIIGFTQSFLHSFAASEQHLSPTHHDYIIIVRYDCPRAIFMALASIAVVLRIDLRRKQTFSGSRADDWLIVEAALVRLEGLYPQSISTDWNF